MGPLFGPLFDSLKYTKVRMSLEEDVFGIKYQPYRKKGANVVLKIEDEEEFERDLLSRTTAPAMSNSGGNDDEFDFDGDANNGTAASTWAPAEKGEGIDVVIIENEGDNNEDTAIVYAPVSDEPKGLSIRDAAAVAFNEIKSVYTNGAAGDISVKMLDEERDANEVITVTRNITSIQEGEDEEEDEEIPCVTKNVDNVNNNTCEIGTSSTTDELHQVWDDINNKKKSDEFSADEVTDTAVDATFQPISYQEALTYLQSLPLDKYKSIIKVSESSGNSFNPFSWLTTKLSYGSHESDLPFPFLLAQVDYDPTDLVMRRMLVTIYLSLMFPLKTSCPIIGEHWDKIGFQGTDPRTDVNRSMKMLSVLQMLHLVEKYETFARNLCQLANTMSVPGSKLDTSWPLFCVSIGFTKEALQSLRGGMLYKRCNKHKSVLLALHDFHRACFFDFTTRLAADPGTHMAIHLNKTKDLCEKNPLALLRSLKKLDLTPKINNDVESFGANEKVDNALTDLLHIQVSTDTENEDGIVQATSDNE